MRIIGLGTLCLIPYFMSFCIGAYAQSNIPASNDFIKNLVPDKTAEKQYKNWKGIRRKPAEKAESENIPKFNVNVTFEFNSHLLTSDGELLLSQLGLALIHRKLRQYTFFIGGHTDAVGSDAYNQELSEKRAQTVRNYLIDEFNISEDRIFAQGYGESKLLIKDNPEADSNRRVEIKNIGPKE